MKTTGQKAYEEDCARQPRYHDTTTRLVWLQLPEYAKQSWEKNPTPREYPDKDILDARHADGPDLLHALNEAARTRRPEKRPEAYPAGTGKD